MIGFSSDGMKEHHPDETCDPALETTFDACVAFDPKRKVDREERVRDDAKMVAGEITVLTPVTRGTYVMDDMVLAAGKILDRLWNRRAGCCDVKNVWFDVDGLSGVDSCPG